MAQLRDPDGQPCSLEVVFYEKAASTQPGGDADRTTADLSQPVARVGVRPEVICRDHLRTWATGSHAIARLSKEPICPSASSTSTNTLSS